MRSDEARLTGAQKALGLAVALVLVVTSAAVGFSIGRTGAAEGTRTLGLGPLGSLRDEFGGSRYVALGDSYSAGEGLDVWFRGTQDIGEGGNRCHRSPLAFSNLLAAANGLITDFVACSGAHRRHVITSTQDHSGVRVSTNGPQLAQAGIDAGVGLITLTIGGNDVGFSSVLRSCALEGACLDRPYGGEDSLRRWAQDQLDLVEDRSARVYRELRAAAPDARIVAVGYPRLFSTAFDRRADSYCALYGAAFSIAERRGLNDLIDQLNGRLQRSAEREAVEFLDIADAFDGHATCSADPWIQFLGSAIVDDGNFHPNALGHAAVSRLLECHLEHSADETMERPVDAELCFGRTSPPEPIPIPDATASPSADPPDGTVKEDGPLADGPGAAPPREAVQPPSGLALPDGLVGRPVPEVRDALLALGLRPRALIAGCSFSVNAGNVRQITLGAELNVGVLAGTSTDTLDLAAAASLREGDSVTIWEPTGAC